MARLRATVATVVVIAAVAAAAMTVAAADPHAVSRLDDVAGAGEPVVAIGPEPANKLEAAEDFTADPTVDSLKETNHTEEDDSDEEEEPKTFTLEALSRGLNDIDGRRWKRRYSPPTCIVKMWEVLKAPAYHRPPWGSPRQVLLIRRIITARRIRGGRLGRRGSRTKAWACTKRWVRTGRRGGGRSLWRPRYMCRYVGTPWRMCASRWQRRRYGGLCGRHLRRVRRTSPALPVQPEGGKRCDDDPEPSPNL